MLVMLPVVVKGGDDVYAIHILVMAGHVGAEVAAAVPTSDGWVHPAAKVKRITRLGRRMLRHVPPRTAGPPGCDPHHEAMT